MAIQFQETPRKAFVPAQDVDRKALFSAVANPPAPNDNLKALLAIKPKRGRPRIEAKSSTFEAMKPWIALNMSRSTWYRRRKETREKHAPSTFA